MKRRQVTKKLRPGRYCILCMGPVHLVAKRGKRTFHCEDCGSQRWRALIADPYLLTRLTPRGMKHWNVGALIEREGRILLQLRAMPPHRWNLIAGHRRRGESAMETLRREVREETGLTITRATRVFADANFPDRCYRGAVVHDWKLYACVTSGRLKKNEESRVLRWWTPGALSRIPLVPATRKILTRIGILN